MGLNAESLTRKYYDSKRGEFLAVDNLTFSCSKGEIFGLLGPNGAGKTTTLRMLTTIIKPSSGSASVNGFDILEDPLKVRAQIGFASTDTGLYERLTPREILNYFALLCRYPKEKITERIKELSATLQMDSFMDTRCEKLSTGMRQKVSIARALVHDPPVLILDEPTTGLDVITSNMLHGFISNCKRLDKCILFSTHIMSEAEKLCDRIGIIHGGKLHAIGTLNELQEQTGKHYLEDIFLSIVQEPGDQ
ncbi:MAG: ATP-binding cassette domain-containing protein [Candidatus Obscuribacterales bacterium]|nr:ATP-binding cassette domain-containing protein [Candidatus Obscuribacterales bacterium]